MTSPSSTVSTTIVVPAYNEENGVRVVLEQLFRVLGGTSEVIVVDDGSTDATAEVARQFPCRLVQHEVNRGKGEALKTGIRHSKGEAVLWLDADGTYPVETIPAMEAALRDSYDLVSASRTQGRERIPAFNRVGNALFRWTVRGVFGFKPYDPCSGLCGVRKVHLDRMGLKARGFAIDSEIALKAGRMRLRMLDIPIEYGDRVGQAKLSGLRDGPQIALGILRHLFWRPSPVLSPSSKKRRVYPEDRAHEAAYD